MVAQTSTLVVLILAAAVCHSRALPIGSADVEQLSQTFRTSVAQAVRENVARQQHPTPAALAVDAVAAETPVLDNDAIDSDAIVANIPIDIDESEAVAAAAQKLAAEAEQAKNAHYSFDTSVRDTINDHSQTRQETRDGLAVHGSYSYSDGFFQRTVHYTADEGGYRVTREETVPIGDGPRYNPLGTADVRSSLTGSYSITADDFRTSSTEAPTTTQTTQTTT